MIIFDGYNGILLDLPAEEPGRLNKWDVLHAEANAILKVAGHCEIMRNTCTLLCL
jgi:deoxycytidylate deaminase